MEDAVRTLELLWGKAPAPRRGPNQTLTVDQLVTTAIGIADSAGLKGVTMRAVGNEVGRTAMSLYTYVPGREVLITVMHDHVHAEVPAPRKVADWRKAVTAWCVGLRDMYVRHPWVLEVSQARPGFGPHEQDVLEGLLRLLARAEVPLAVRPTVTSALYSIVREAAKRKVEALAESAQSAEWWAERGKALQAVAPDFAERYPESTAIARHQSTQGPQPWIKAAEDAFTGAITLLLASLE
ncbi:TetR/AcrR family transcriptional regulator [Kribbella monticola]|uniref:TetR/AcrR family transcriptional regulator n=1 Tax=Kribbella monticola TaxID=2185285 RepID=UPI001300B512|nr:TetR/AcrR family transcriptional regulator C-terminal domain-containing protein [Kribbella monticola]